MSKEKNTLFNEYIAKPLKIYTLPLVLTFLAGHIYDEYRDAKIRLANADFSIEESNRVIKKNLAGLVDYFDSKKTTGKNPLNNEVSEKKRVYLTIDDGPTKWTEKIINSLQEGQNVTFFFLGQNLEKPYAKKCIEKAIEKGCTIGNHSYFHSDFSKISYKQGKKEILKTQKLIENFIKEINPNYENPRIFRFPYGEQGGENAQRYAELLKKRGFKEQRWDFDSNDWILKTKENGVKELVKRIQLSFPPNCKHKNKIILFHDTKVTATKILLEYIKAYTEAGYEISAIKE